MAGFRRLGVENVPLEQCLGRVLGADVVSGEDLPPMDRSTMDGFAVRAADTFGASDAVPAFLTVAGRVAMGEVPKTAVGRGQAAAIPTGGFLPEGADAVVMIEYTNRVSDEEIEITRPVTLGENVLKRADDVRLGETILGAHRRLRPQDIGMLAGLGVTGVDVYRRPRVAVISTGDEIVAITQTPEPGQIRDINSHAVCALAQAAGALPVRFDIVKDEPDLLRAALAKALDESDVVVLSGGSSVGERDHMVAVAGSFSGAEILAHGVAISPGKPMLLVRIGDKPVLGLPGHPVSAMIVAQVFLTPLLKYLGGEALNPEPAGQKVRAVLAASVHSPHGREEYIRVRLVREADRVAAAPVFGKSGMLSTLVKADGFIVVPIHAEGIADGSEVDVYLF